MSDIRTLLEHKQRELHAPPGSFDRLLRRRDRKRRNQRLAAGVVGMAVFVAAILIVWPVGLPDPTEGPVGGVETGPRETGPTESGPTESGPTESGPTESGPTESGPRVAVGPVPKTDYLLDLDTGEMTPLPESIVGTKPGVTGDYAASPDGSKLAYTSPGDNGEDQVFVANLEGTGVEQVTSGDRAGNPAWSPDSSKIAYVGDTGNIFVLDLATGSSTQVTFYPRSLGVPNLSFSPDGGSILYNLYDEEASESWLGIWTVPALGGESLRLVDLGYGAEFSPDGSILSYSAGCEGRKIAICFADADGSEARAVARCHFRCEYAKWSPDGTRIAFSSEWGGYYKVSVMAVATGEVTHVTRGMEPVWLDDHTLIVECLGVYEPNQACSG